MILVCMFVISVGALTDLERKAFCDTLTCESNVRDGEDSNACGIKDEGAGFRLKLFENECKLLKYGCEVRKGEEFGLTKRHYCSFMNLTNANENNSKLLLQHSYDVKTDNLLSIKSKEQKINGKDNDEVDLCKQFDCKNYTNKNSVSVCAIRNDGKGFRLRKLANECVLQKLNCKENFKFHHTDTNLCTDLEVTNEDSIQTNDNLEKSKCKERKENNDKRKRIKTVIIVNGSLLDFNGDINDTIDDFFASTHFINFPINEVALDSIIENDTRRSLFLKKAGPIKVFTPWIKIPKNDSKTKVENATLASCFHQCPKKCPDVYAPVCGMPGINAREPSLMFQNHCLMDQAQCKMYKENLSPTSLTSAYVESSFMFCLGDQLSSLYRFLPLIRSLQHMGRLKTHAVFKYRIKNLRFFNNLIRSDTKLMG